MSTDNSKAHLSNYFTQSLKDRDPDLYASMADELDRQQHEIELIASENIVSKAILEAQGSVLTNKYAEGYPGKRYYGGCQHVDVAETLAIERACKLFDCGYANVQPNSGSQANQGVFLALLKPGDTILGMDLASGGHLTHGAPPNMSGKWFNAITYGVKEDTHLIDYDQVEALALEHKPQLIICGGSAYSRQVDFARFREIADKVGAFLHVDMAHFAGLVAGKAHPSPFPHAHVATTTTHKSYAVITGGTDTHLALIDLSPKGVKGNAAEAALGRAYMTCNKNGIPFDKEKFTVTSGIRVGSPAATTRGFGTDEFYQVGKLMAEVLDALAENPEGNPEVEASVRERVKALTAKFPIYN